MTTTQIVGLRKIASSSYELNSKPVWVTAGESADGVFVEDLVLGLCYA